MKLFAKPKMTVSMMKNLKTGLFGRTVSKYPAMTPDVISENPRISPLENLLPPRFGTL